jgi:hypothetical protein
MKIWEPKPPGTLWACYGTPFVYYIKVMWLAVTSSSVPCGNVTALCTVSQVKLNSYHEILSFSSFDVEDSGLLGCDSE